MWQKNFHFHSFSLLASQGSDQSRGAFRNSQLKSSPNAFCCIPKKKFAKWKEFVTKCENFLDFFILKNFSKFLEKFHFSISISRHFQFTFHSRSRFWDIFISLFTLDLDIKAFSFHFSFSKWVNQIFISLFTSRNEWTRFPFHFSLLELPISTLAGHWPSGALAVSQFRDPIHPSTAFRFECSNLLPTVIECPGLNLVVSRKSVEVSRESVESQ